jgi:hypothetical protein
MIYIYTIKITRVGHKGPGGHQWPAGGRRCSASRTSARPLCPHARTRWCAGGSDDGRDGRAAAGPRRNNPARACDCVSLFLIQGQGGGGSPPLRCRLSSCTPYSDRRGGAEGGGHALVSGGQAGAPGFLRAIGWILPPPNVVKCI